MARKASFTVLETPAGWQVNTPSTLAASGRRERHYFQTKKAAIAHAQTLRERFLAHGAGASIIRPSLAEDATRAMELLSPWGKSLTEAARFLAAALERDKASVPFEIASESWFDSMEGLRPKSVVSYRMTSTRLLESFKGRLMSTIEPEEIQAVVFSNGGTATRSLHRRNARALWNFAAKKGWCQKDVFAKVDTPRAGDAKEIAFLTVPEVEALLTTAEKHFPQAVPAYAVALFAGVRREELTKLEAFHVTPEGIELPAAVTKKGRRRHVTPSPTLAAWLREYPFEPCPNWLEVDRACRRLAGWDVASVLLKEPPKPTRGAWPQNALRHTHASYAIAAGASIESMLFEFGHSGGPQLLREHYLGRASKKEAVAFFAIGPKGQKIPTIAAA